jgi:hypothetical protein
MMTSRSDAEEYQQCYREEKEYKYVGIKEHFAGIMNASGPFFSYLYSASNSLNARVNARQSRAGFSVLIT